MPTMTPLTLVNGQTRDRIHSRDRGLAYGHGVFETLLLTSARAAFLDWHLERLLEGCRRLQIPTDGLEQGVRQDLAWAQTQCREGVVKIIITAGVGGRGYLLPEPMHPCRILQLSALPDWPDAPAEQGIRVRWCQTRLATQPALAGIKHLNRLEQVLARAEWRDPAIREGLLRDGDGHVIEGTLSNLCWIRGQVLYTPALQRCGVAGVMRRWVLSVAASLGLEIRIGDYTCRSVESADELFVCNSLAGLWPVVQLEQQRFAVGTYTRALQGLLKKEYER